MPRVSTACTTVSKRFLVVSIQFLGALPAGWRFAWLVQCAHSCQRVYEPLRLRQLTGQVRPCVLLAPAQTFFFGLRRRTAPSASKILEGSVPMRAAVWLVVSIAPFNIIKG